MLGLNSNIMSLGGIAIAIGAMIDAAIVMIENAHKHLEHGGERADRVQLVIDACREVGPPLFFSLLIITVSFLPVFTLEAQEGRLFAPLAYTKTFAMAGAALLSVTLVPVLMLLFIRGRIVPEAKNPLTGKENLMRHAIRYGWFTSSRRLNAPVILTLQTDMIQAGWNDKLFKDLQADQDIDFPALIGTYFTPHIVDTFVAPFVNKPGQEVFFGANDAFVSQLTAQDVWRQSGGDVHC
jgi:hypothetical protein